MVNLHPFLPDEILGLGQARSVIRELFEYGRQRAAVVGEDNVFDFSLGNPSVPAPDAVRKVASALLERDPVWIHGYTSAAGDPTVREALAQSISRRFSFPCSGDQLYLTVGAAAALCICFRALFLPGDECIAFTPYFPEYKVFVEQNGGRFITVASDPADFQIPLEAFEAAVGPRTKAVIVNSPNNPSGVVYTKDRLEALAEILRKKEAQYGHPIFLLADEPYREIVYQGVEVPFLPALYHNTLICYSYSKSLSLPGERIGYVLVPEGVTDSREVYAAVCGAGRSLGYVNAPSLFQRVAAACGDLTADLEIYETNKNLLYHGLLEAGYSCVEPGGAFYLFPRALEENANAFSLRARAHDLLVVPGDGFGCPGHVRISYCVPTERIRRALPIFALLAKEYHVK